MSKLVNLEGQKFNHWTVIKELSNGKVLCECDCENRTRKIVDKYSVKSGKSKSCGCSKAENLTGQTFGYWTVLKDNGNTALCKCVCGTERLVQKGHLKNGASLSCGCKSGRISTDTRNKDIIGKTFGYLTVISALGNGKLLCRCICGSEKEYPKYRLLDGTTKSCGCKHSELISKAQLKDMTGHKINDWTILQELGHDRVLCRCSCGEVKEVTKSAILDGRSKSCGHNTNKFVDMTGKKFGYWTIEKELGYGFVACKCVCGSERVMKKAIIVNGYTKSCGCKQYENFTETAMSMYGEVTANKINNPREKWQIEAVSNAESFIKYLTELQYKPTIQELTNLLGVNESNIGRIIKKYNAINYIDFRPSRSSYEKEIVEFIKTFYYGTIETNKRNLISNKELDIYIPDKKLAIEFNGSYWHSSLFKDKYYHQQKVIDADKAGIRLIHIYEYEWLNSIQQIRIKNYIRDILSNDKDIIYARNLEICKVNFNVISRFEEENHLQGSAYSNINFVLKQGDNIVQVLTFGTPRFNTRYEYEIIRSCTKSGVIVVGGFERLFKAFVDEYKANSIISYVDRDKFVGDSYKRVGFIQNKELTEPGYVWLDASNFNVLSRFQTQKSKLIELGYGSEDDTEESIMTRLNYVKIYNSGNMVLSWYKDRR